MSNNNVTTLFGPRNGRVRKKPGNSSVCRAPRREYQPRYTKHGLAATRREARPSRASLRVAAKAVAEKCLVRRAAELVRAGNRRAGPTSSVGGGGAGMRAIWQCCPY